MRSIDECVTQVERRVVAARMRKERRMTALRSAACVLAAAALMLPVLMPGMAADADAVYGIGKMRFVDPKRVKAFILSSKLPTRYG